MLDDHTKRTRIIRAALKLSETSSWTSLSLADIAAEAGLRLAEIRLDFRDKQDILRSFSQDVDRAVLRQADPDPAEPALDRLFDVLMTRFEVMAPFKRSLQAIARDLRRDPLGASQHAAPFMTSQYWMLNAANINAETALGAVRVIGLAGIYGRVTRVWFDDDDPGQARTMAALDRELRQGARLMGRVEAAFGGLARLGEGLRQALNVAGAGVSNAATRAGSGPTNDFAPEETKPSPMPRTGPGPTAAAPRFEPNGSGNH